MLEKNLPGQIYTPSSYIVVNYTHIEGMEFSSSYHTANQLYPVLWQALVNFTPRGWVKLTTHLLHHHHYMKKDGRLKILVSKEDY